MKIFKFSWCVMSFDQECHIEASSESKAKEIFAKEVIGENKTWAANHATCSDLSKVYKKAVLKNIKINFKEIV